MLVFLPQRLILLAVPKTGTTALEQVLAGRAEIAFRRHPAVKHLALSTVQGRILPLIDHLPAPAFETAALIREPVDWLRSWYRYRVADRFLDHPASTARVSFATFIEGYLTPDQPPYARIGRQSAMLRPKPGRPGIDHLYRYEAMGAFCGFLGARLGCAVDPPRMNVSPAVDTSLPPALETRLRAALADDLALWTGARGDQP